MTSTSPELSSPLPSVPIKKRKDMPVGLMVSIGLHVILFAVLITVKVVQYIVEEPAEFTQPAARNYDLIPKKEVKVNVEKHTRAGGGGRPPKVAIAVDRPSSFMVPKVDVAVSTLHGKLGSRGSGRGFGDGNGDGDGPGSGGPGRGFRDFQIRGVSITASNLGVILDVSNSIKPFVPALRKEIEKEFEGAVVKEVFGCWFTLKNPPPRPNLPPLESAYLAAVDLIKKDGCDAIYWFSDLNDSVDKEAIEKFATLVRVNNVRFYIISVGKEPNPGLAEIAKKSGGTVKVEKKAPPKK